LFNFGSNYQSMEKPDQIRQVIHLQFVGTDEHHYFGSIQAIYDHFTRDQLGIAPQTLYNQWAGNSPYINTKVILRKGRLIQKKNRSKDDTTL